MDISPVDRVYAKVRLRILDADGNPAAPTSVDLAVLGYRIDPTAATAWTVAPFTAYATPDKDGYTGEVTPLIAGGAADPTGALTVPTNPSVLWLRITDSPEVQAVRVGFISVS